MSNELVREQWAERFGRPDPKIVCVGLNYSDHAAEQGVEAPKAPLLFGKFSNTLCGDGDPILLQPGVGHVDAECELAVVIGERASRVPEASALDVIAAYTCANDLSARDAQFGDGQWFRGKTPDGFCPVGPRPYGDTGPNGAPPARPLYPGRRPENRGPPGNTRTNRSERLNPRDLAERPSQRTGAPWWPDPAP